MIELPIRLVRSTESDQDVAALPAQLAEQLRGLILAGTLAPGDPLPSSRALAQRLNISRGSVVAAFEQLSAEGYLQTSKAGTCVAENLKLQKISRTPASGSSSQPRESAPRMRYDLTPGNPDISLLTTSAWRAAWRKAAAEPGVAYPASGSENLQKQLAEHLRIMRHVVRAPDEILVTAGARDGFRLVLSALRQEASRGQEASHAGAKRPLKIAVENPGYPSLHRIPAAFGHEIIPIEVDEHGLNPGKLPRDEHKPDLVLVAPSHQYPLGASMPVARRLELIDWARENDAFIIEDDYDSELRYTGDPLPALAALDTAERVITLGSFTKTLTPGLGIGYLLLPAQLHQPVADLRKELGSPVSSITQDALADFLASGGARRHIARMRRVYGQRRELLLAALEQTPSWVQVLPMDGGLHVVLKFLGRRAKTETEHRIAQQAETAGIALGTLGDYWESSGSPHETRDFGLIVGFGGVNDRVLAEGTQVLCGLLQAVTDGE